MLSVSPWNLLFTILNLLILLVLMKKFLYTPVLGIIAKRQELIDSQFAQAKASQEKAEQMYHSILWREGCNMAIEFVDGKPHCIAAWGKNRCDLSDTVGELICIHSLQNNWAKGYGSAMMEYVLVQLQQAQYESVILWVFEENSRARKFYEKHGFELTEQKKLANGIAELMYMKKI